MTWTPSDKPAVTLADSPLEEMSKNERIKLASQGLFFVSDGKTIHTFADELDALTRGEAETIGGEAKELSKFFGIYRQQIRGERGRKTGEHVFMVRIKCPAGGELSATQWAALDDAAEQFADGTIRVTSRQGVQYHHVRGPKLAKLVRHLNRHYRDEATLSACGDVSRNVMASPVDGLVGPGDPRGRELAVALAAALAPRTSSYFQVFLSDDEGRTVKPMHSDEPLYGPQYLPRKFKVGIAHPDDNSVDVLTQDVGLVPVLVEGSCDGSLWDLHSGGGLGQNHNNPQTAPLLGLFLGRIAREQVIDAVRAIATLQKEHGERRDRRLARWKYTIRRLGLERVRRQLRERFAIRLQDVEAQPLAPGRIHLGFGDAPDGTSFYGISIENGRIRPDVRKGIRAASDDARSRRADDTAPGRDADRRARSRRAARDPRRPRHRAVRGGIACAQSRHRVSRKAHLRAGDDRRRERAAALLRRARSRGSRRHRPRDPHDRLPEPLRASAHRRDRHLRLRQERPRDPGGRLALRHAPRVGALRARLRGADGLRAGRPLPRRQGTLPRRYASRRLDRSHRLQDAAPLDRALMGAASVPASC